MFANKKKNKKKPKVKKETEIKDISSNEILVRVYKDFGSNTQILKAEYKAVEKRDAYNNLISINDKYSHNEDTDFSIADVYREMGIILEFKNKGREEKIQILQKKIDYQDKLLRYLEKFPKLNAEFNYCDEDLKSRDYKILKNKIKNHDGEGAYFTIENGVRVYSFMACDGYLSPIWHGVDRYTQYPDHTRKIKITVQEDMRMREEIGKYTREQRMGNLLFWAFVILAVLIVANLILGSYLLNKIEETGDADKAYQASMQCARLTTELNKAFSEKLKDEFVFPEDLKIEPKVQNLTTKKLG